MKIKILPKKLTIPNRKAIVLFNAGNILFIFWGRFKMRGYKGYEVLRYGITFKHQAKTEIWKHYSGIFETGKLFSRMIKIEFSKHKSKHQQGDRILKTKKFIRLKIVL